MKALMDEVRFEKGGAVVHMCKKPTLGQPQRGKADDTETATYRLL